MSSSSPGLVNRRADPRPTDITGRVAMPRRRHVIVVGLGQIGFRLCAVSIAAIPTVLIMARTEKAVTQPWAWSAAVFGPTVTVTFSVAARCTKGR
jgi:hypothetical protein